MEKNQLIKVNGVIYRVLTIEEDSILMIDCIRKTMPNWYDIDKVRGYEDCTEKELLEVTGTVLLEEEDLSSKARKTAHERFTVVAGVLPFLADDRFRTEAIRRVAKEQGISIQTARTYLCQYLAFQDISVLVPKKRCVPDKELTKDEKNFRWALNKFYFTRHKNSLKTAYTYMLKEKYCDGEGNLLTNVHRLISFVIFIVNIKRNRMLLYQEMG